MSAKIERFKSRKQLLQDRDGEDLKQLLLDFASERNLDEDAIGRIVAAVDARTATSEGWTFVMLSPAQNAQVVSWLANNSKRPKVAAVLWAQMFTAMRNDTGEIMLNRNELAKLAKIRPAEVSSIISELVRIGAIIRRRDGRHMRYFMNPNVATHLGQKARESAQAEAPQLRLV